MLFRVLVRIESNVLKVPGAVLVGDIVGLWEILLRPDSGQLNSISTSSLVTKLF